MQDTESATQRNQDDYVRQSVIDEAGQSATGVFVVSGAYAARQREDGTIELFEHKEDI